MAHGAGGTVMQDLIKDIIVRNLGGSGAEVPLEALDDSGVINDIVLKSDSHTVKPLFFPGGDIGRLAVCGTVNDIAVMGADPVALASGFIIEEGFPIQDLEIVVKSMAQALQEAGTHIITGDTKVMEKGSLEKLVVNTSGIGQRSKALDRNITEVKRFRPFGARWLLDSNLRTGDKIIVSGTVGDHGVAILSKREGYDFGSEITSDVTPLNHLVKSILDVGGVVKAKDPTRGGLANTLNEWSEKSSVGITVHDDRIPINEGVKAACEMLGIDPLEVGNEGKIAVAVIPEKVEEVLDALRQTREGRKAEIIGEAIGRPGEVIIVTEVGGKRILAPPIGDPIPRIC
jgi:hydrogenase expression/formation protein HypE